MLMKVFNKGQVVIPAEIRKSLGIEVGDLVEVSLNNDALVIKKSCQRKSSQLAGSLTTFGQGKRFPSRDVMRMALTNGLVKDQSDAD